MHTFAAGRSGTILMMIVTRTSRYCTSLLLSSLLLLGGCGGGITEAPSVPPDEVLTNTIDLLEIVSDIQVRIVPNLPESALRNQLSVALIVLTRALDQGLALPVRAAVRAANNATDRLEPSLVDDADARAELAVVRLELDAIGSAK